MVTRTIFRTRRRRAPAALACAALVWTSSAVAQDATPPIPPPPAATSPGRAPVLLPPPAATPPATTAPATPPATPPATSETEAPVVDTPAAQPALPQMPPAADEGPAAPAPRIHHAPPSSARQRQPLPITATFEHPELIQSAAVVYRTATGVMGATPLQRSAGETYVATIPASALIAPWIGYAIEIVRPDGAKVDVFASRAELHVVQVLEEASDARERALLARLGGKRSVVAVSGEYVRFGKTQPSRPLPCAAGQERCTEGQSVQPSVDDQYYRIEAGYTYRPLGTVAEFSLRGGIIRGTSLVPTDTFDEDKYDVGANYGAPTVRFRLADTWHLETGFLTSITEIGFSVGFGSALLIGDPYGTKLTLGFETIGPGDRSAYFGSRFYSRVDIAASSTVSIAPLIEVTDMPHAESFGVRLLGEAAFALGGGFTAQVRGGYQARKSTSGGPSAGGGLSLAF